MYSYTEYFVSFAGYERKSPLLLAGWTYGSSFSLESPRSRNSFRSCGRAGERWWQGQGGCGGGLSDLTALLVMQGSDAQVEPTGRTG